MGSLSLQTLVVGSLSRALLVNVKAAVGGIAMRWLLLFIALAAQNEVRGLYVAAHKHSVLENETHDHHHEPEHEQNHDDEATVMDAPMADEGLDPDLLSSSLFASNIASALADETPAVENVTADSA